MLHKNWLPPNAVKVTEAPLQIVPSLLEVPESSVIEILGVGRGLTVMVVEVLEIQLLALVTVTEYVVFMVGATVIEAVVAPVLHKYWAAAGAVSVTLAPIQMTPSLGIRPLFSTMVIGPTGRGVTVMVRVAVFRHPLTSVAVTVYVVVVAGVTFIVAVLAPVDQT